MAARGIAFISYPVTDMKRAVEFYNDVLGLTKSGLDSDAWVEFDVAGTTFGVGNFEQLGKAGTAQALALEVDDMAQTRAGLKERGHDTMEPFDTPICQISMVTDPDGNTVWLHQAKR